MKNSIFLFLLCFSISQLSAQMSSAPPPKLESLQSEIVGEDYKLLITLPFGFSPENNTYPVFYYLDAAVTSGMMNELAIIKMFSKDINEVILVGISYSTNPAEYGQIRMRDYVPKSANLDASAGGEKFLQFIKTELIPHMEEKYSADPNDRGLMGFSLGGLFTSWVIEEEPDLFHKLAILSPSIDNSKNDLLERPQLLTNIQNSNHLKAFVACGSMESESMISNTNRVHELLQANKNIRSTKVIFEGEDHATVITTAMARGLLYLYRNEYRGYIQKAFVLYRKKEFAASLKLFETAFKAAPNQIDEDGRFNIACLYSLNGDSDNAFKHLQILADSKYAKVENLKKDSDFNSLHSDARWTSLIEQVKSNKDKQE